VDLTGIFAHVEGQIFTDYAHLTPEGNRMVADRIMREIARRELAATSTEDVGEGP